MNENGNDNTVLPEAPVSFNIKAISPTGYDCQLTLRGHDSKELMPRALSALDWLAQHGFTPPFYPRKKEEPATTEGGNGNAPMCPTHNKPMKKSSKGKGWYCPVKIVDDGGDGKPVYCKQKAE